MWGWVKKECFRSQCRRCEIEARCFGHRWSISNGIEAVTICTDCVVFVQGLSNPSSANLALQRALLDFRYLCNFLKFVRVRNVTRLKVKAAHDVARAAL